MLGGGKIFTYLHNVHEALHLQVGVTEFNHTAEGVNCLCLFNDNIWYTLSHSMDPHVGQMISLCDISHNHTVHIYYQI
jgi:hypothetical protein